MKKLILVATAVIMLSLTVACPEKATETQTPEPTSPPETTEKPTATQPTTPTTTTAPTTTQPTSALPNILFTTPASWADRIIIGTGDAVAGLAGDMELYVAAWLSNSGTKDVINPGVALHIDSKFVKNIELKENIPPGEGVVVCACLKDLDETVPLGEGDHEFSFIADSAMSIEESDETDNKVTATVHVPSLITSGPDIVPSPVAGGKSIVVDNQNGSYRDIRIKAGVTNIGNETGRDVIVELKKGTTKLFTWTIDYVTPSELEIVEVTIGEILEHASISAGVTSLTLDCKVTSPVELDTENNSETVENLRIALLPVPKSISLTDTGKKIQAAIENNTWYTDENSDELLDIAKDLLEGVYPYWSNLRIYILPFDEYNERYAEKFGDTQQEIENLKNTVANDRIRGQRYIEGSIDGASIYFREGTFLQILPNLIFEMGELFYAQKNYSGYYTSFSLRGHELASNLLEAYVIAFMCENYGLDGLINMSVSLGHIPHPSIGGSDWESVGLRRIWAIAAEIGYPEGGVPAQVFLDAFMDFTQAHDPVSYLEELDNKANLLDSQTIANIISWRLVDKNLTMLPESVVEKINPDISTLSFDSLVSYQYFVALPY